MHGVCREKEGSFGFEVDARALGQLNVPECGRGFLFLFCFSAAKIPFSFFLLFCFFTMNANTSASALPLFPYYKKPQIPLF